ncbi:family 2B encapsulin nanocompartment shell protein [Kitasatospora sp. DSM 101779]|uniref:family 2B encapsulin nanocompartment shell protein n=1 Tax=Kitasatospora sp. DSM 101779 TaxID=2853165 RepID=UPI0021DB059A|nr:family 2B encapsulin nanocompartment shell protein [Kitasatospora sp. DSM 101779]MCU7824079.1 cyclic nucleotide-binding domain-containing protein [Kitasatospora sp. DSM 101779]
MSTETSTGVPARGGEPQLRQQSSLSTAGARNLASTTKSAPQMQEISSRWLLRMLPWVQVSGGTYRVNRRLSHAAGRGRVAFVRTGPRVEVLPPSLRELPLLRDVRDDALLAALAAGFVQRDFRAGEQLVAAGDPLGELLLVAHGKVERHGTGRYGDATVLGSHADGDHLGDEALLGGDARWPVGLHATTAGTLLALPRAAFEQVAATAPELRERLRVLAEGARRPQNKYGEAAIEMSAGHTGEHELPTTFVDYELAPREYELSVAQTVLRVHTRVADLYNQPMDQTEHQLRLTVEALRERQEHELVNNPEFGLLTNADHSQRIQTHSGPPTPDDMDDLLSRRRGTRFYLAHPRAIAAFGRELNRRGLYPGTVEVHGRRVPAWRGVPVLSCNKIPIADGTSSILAVRTGEDSQGAIGLHQTGIPDEFEPSLSVRFAGIDEKAVISYLVTAYYSAAILVPDAVGVLENVVLDGPRG